MMMISPMPLLHWVKILTFFFFLDTCIISASLPSHSATILCAVYVQYVWFWSLFFVCSCFHFLMVWSAFVLHAFEIFGESGMQLHQWYHQTDFCKWLPWYQLYINSKRLKLPPSGRSKISSHSYCLFKKKKENWSGPVSRSAFTSFSLHVYFIWKDLIGLNSAYYNRNVTQVDVCGTQGVQY